MQSSKIVLLSWEGALHPLGALDGVLTDIVGVFGGQATHAQETAQLGLSGDLDVHLAACLRSRDHFRQQSLPQASDSASSADQQNPRQQDASDFRRVSRNNECNDVWETHLIVAEHVGLEIGLAGSDEFAGEMKSVSCVQVVPIGVNHPGRVDLA